MRMSRFCVLLLGSNLLQKIAITARTRSLCCRMYLLHYCGPFRNFYVLCLDKFVCDDRSRSKFLIKNGYTAQNNKIKQTQLMWVNASKNMKNVLKINYGINWPRKRYYCNTIADYLSYLLTKTAEF